MPSTARQLRQPPTIEAIKRVPYFTDVADFLNTPIKELPKLIPIYRYSGWIGLPITTILRIYLRVNGQR